MKADALNFIVVVSQKWFPGCMRGKIPKAPLFLVFERGLDMRNQIYVGNVKNS